MRARRRDRIDEGRRTEEWFTRRRRRRRMLMKIYQFLLTRNNRKANEKNMPCSPRSNRARNHCQRGLLSATVVYLFSSSRVRPLNHEAEFGIINEITAVTFIAIRRLPTMTRVGRRRRKRNLIVSQWARTRHRLELFANERLTSEITRRRVLTIVYLTSKLVRLNYAAHRR